MKEAVLYQKLERSNVQCNLCAHRCVIHPEKSGICKVRENINGELYTKVYGRAIARHIDPVEKNHYTIFTRAPKLIHLPHQDVTFTAGSVKIGKYPRFPAKVFWKWGKR